MDETLSGLAPEGPRVKLTERDMLDQLEARYTRVRPGTDADQFVRARHVRYPSAYGHARAIADFIVADTFAPYDLTGFEVKVSRADWLTELRSPRKSEWWRKHCNRWFLVTSHRDIVRDDLPDGWGHITLTTGGLRIVTRAPLLAPIPLSQSALALLGRAIAKTRTLELHPDRDRLEGAP